MAIRPEKVINSEHLILKGEMEEKDFRGEIYLNRRRCGEAALRVERLEKGLRLGLGVGVG